MICEDLWKSLRKTHHYGIRRSKTINRFDEFAVAKAAVQKVTIVLKEPSIGALLKFVHSRDFHGKGQTTFGSCLDMYTKWNLNLSTRPLNLNKLTFLWSINNFLILKRAVRFEFINQILWYFSFLWGIFARITCGLL